MRYDAKMSSKNQITIPARVREQLGLEPEDTVSFVVVGDKISVESTQLTIMDLYQSIPAPESRTKGRELTIEEVMELDGEWKRIDSGEILT